MMWTDAVRVRSVWVRRRPGPLLVRSDPPELSLDAAITRGWRLAEWPPPSLPLLLPYPPEDRFLPTYPLPAWDLMPEGWWYPHDWRPRIVTETAYPNYL